MTGRQQISDISKERQHPIDSVVHPGTRAGHTQRELITDEPTFIPNAE